MGLTFFKVENNQDLQEIYEYTTDAFSDSPDFNWTLDDLKAELKNGWKLFGVRNQEKSVVAAIFLKEDRKGLLTKNTGIRIGDQGSGYNHEIKEFFEKSAKKGDHRKIFHYCRIDNFRMYSLNEGHGYIKTGKFYSNNTVVEWVKEMK